MAELLPEIEFGDTWSGKMSNTIKVSHKWTINNFSFHRHKPLGEFINSPTFSTKGNRELKWYLRAYPNGSVLKDYLSIHLLCTSSDISNVTAKFKLYVIDVNNVRKNSLDTSIRMFGPTNEVGIIPFIEKQLLLSEASVLIPNDNLTIVCEIEIFDGFVEMTGKSEPPLQFQMLKSRMNEDFMSLFVTQRFTDVTFAVKGKEIQGHKMILAARSPVFLEMFEGNMQGLKKIRVEINHIDYNVFMEILRFIYTDKAYNLERLALKLLAAATNFRLDRLKSICAEELYKRLDMNNIVDILIVSHLHKADELKTLAINFVCDHRKNVMMTASYDSMVKTYPDLRIEILEAMSTRESGLKAAKTAKTK